MFVLDAQVHPALPLSPWNIELEPEVSSTVSIELTSAAMESIGVDAALVYASADECRTAASRYPDRFRGVVSVNDPASVGDPRALAATLAEGSAIAGIRILGDAPSGDSQRRFLDQGVWADLLDVAQSSRIPVVVFAPMRMGVIHDIASRHPELPVVVDHLGFPPPPAFPPVPVTRSNLAGLLALAALPNVAVKLTGAPALSTEAYPFRDLWPAIRSIIDGFGPDRVMWGSDVTRVTGRNAHPAHPGGRHSYRELLGYITETELLHASEKAAVLAQTAQRWFRWS